jgi:two-component system OmpR family sensor kinase
MKTGVTHSLRRRLLWFALAAILLTAIVQAVTAYRGALQQADDMFDYHLQQMAYSLRGGIPLTPFTERSPTDDDDDFVIQIWGANGAQLYRSAHSALPPRAVLGFSDVNVKGTNYRVYSLQSPLQTIQIAQDLSARQSRASALAARAVLPIALLAPLLMLAVWWVISSSLAPIERTRQQVASRAADDLSALPEDDLPEEVLPLVHELNALFGRVNTAFDLQRQFVADAAHELRSPLTALKLQAQALRRPPDDQSPDTAARAAAVTRLNDGIDRAIRLAEQLLALARQEAPVDTSASTTLDLHALARQAITDALPLAHARQIDLGLLGDQNVALQGLAEPVLTLLRNLMDNAIKYTPEGGQVDVSLQAPAGGGALLLVEDSGPGIALHERTRVFDRFVRCADASASGSGLGLAIVKAIATRMGATVTLGTSARLGGLQVEVRFSA